MGHPATAKATNGRRSGPDELHFSASTILKRSRPAHAPPSLGGTGPVAGTRNLVATTEDGRLALWSAVAVKTVSQPKWLAASTSLRTSSLNDVPVSAISEGGNMRQPKEKRRSGEDGPVAGAIDGSHSDDVHLVTVIELIGAPMAGGWAA